jgi:UrcA family protein
MFSPDTDRGGTGTVAFKSALIGGLIGLLPLAAVAAQDSPSRVEGPAVIVKYADLDINTPAGAEKLYERIEQAAAQLCPQVASQELARYAASLRCRNAIVAHAVSGIDSPQLAAVYASRSHHMARSPV